MAQATASKRRRPRMIRDPLPGHTCRVRRCGKPMRVAELTQRRNPANKGHLYGAVWECPGCNNAVFTKLGQRDFTRLKSKYPKLVRRVANDPQEAIEQPGTDQAFAF